MLTEAILGRLPERIRTVLIARAAEIEYPIEVVVEMAIAFKAVTVEAIAILSMQNVTGIN